MTRCFSQNTLDDRDVKEIEKTLCWYQQMADLLKEDDFVNRKKGDLGETLLHYYTRCDNDRNDKNICNCLLKYGANINCVDNSEKTPLHRAVAACKIDITLLLLNHGAYVNAQDADLNTPLHIASTLNLQLCGLLLKHGADPNIKNDSHETPLSLAVQHVNNALLHSKNTVKLLLKHGGNVSVTTLHQRNAIELASILCNEDVFHWCRLNLQNSTGTRSILINFGVFSSCKVEKSF